MLICFSAKNDQLIYDHQLSQSLICLFRFFRQSDTETRVLTDMSGNLMQSVDTTREVGVSKSISQNLIGKDSENEGARTGKRKRSAPPHPSNTIPKSIDVISEAKYLSLGRSAKRKYEMAYGNAEGTFYGLKSSRLETPQELIAKTRKCYKELMISEERFLLCAGAPGRRGNSYEPDSAEVDVEGSIQLPFEELVNLDILDGEN